MNCSLRLAYQFFHNNTKRGYIMHFKQQSIRRKTSKKRDFGHLWPAMEKKIGSVGAGQMLI